MPVYIIQAGAAGPVKIGWTTKPADERCRYLQIGNHEELTVLRTLEGNPTDERWFHHHFRDGCVRGEWFTFVPEMLTISIDDMRRSEKNRDRASEPLSREIIAAGSVSALAQKIGVTPQAVSAWERVPAERAKDVEAATGVPRYELRPDLWDPPLFSQQAI